uniref:Putative dual kunitz salivary protein n=1 Tax=Ornithodoros turicata TaxID=34597 RepID=A0A2R5L5B9_9ACAR
MEAKVLICILVFLLGVSHSARGIADKCRKQRQKCPDKHTALRRYFFDQTKERCSSFFACPGEGDNFYPMMKDCVKDCRPKQRQPKCFEKELTTCRGDTPGKTAWTHVRQTKQCKEVGNACGGTTKNKFASKDECVAECFGFTKAGLQKKYKPIRKNRGE